MWLASKGLLALFLVLDVTLLALAGEEETRTENKEISTAQLVSHLLENYDKSVPPPGGPTVVELGIFIQTLDEVNAHTMDFSLTLDIIQRWTDPRLTFVPFDNQTLQQFKLPNHALDEIWIPDAYFYNTKKSTFPSKTKPNEFLVLQNTGTVLLTSHNRVTISCPMDLRNYPFNTHMCSLKSIIYGYSNENIIYKWLQPIMFANNLVIPQYSLDNDMSNCTHTFVGILPCLEVKLFFKRNLLHSIVQFYVPSALLVIISWLSFWISPDAIPARVTIGMMTVLTMTTQSTAANSQLPRVPYMKAIDIWMSACLIFVFVSLLEFAAIHVFLRKGIRQNQRHDTTKSSAGQEDEIAIDQLSVVIPMEEDVCEAENSVHCTTYKEGCHGSFCTDKLSRVLFPIAFLIFNMIYWPVCIMG